MSDDPEVDRPAHYDGDECMKRLERASWGRDGCLFNIGKYLYRLSEKGRPLQDCEKALWYATRLVENRFYDRPITPEELQVIKACIVHGQLGLDGKDFDPNEILAAGMVSGEVVNMLSAGLADS